MPGCPVAGLVCAHVINLPRRCVGMNTLSVGHSPGGYSVEFSAISLLMSHSIAFTQHVAGRMMLGSLSSFSRECTLERASALVFFDPG